MNMHSFSAARQSIGYMEATGANLSKSLGRLSSGLKVKIDEDAGGLAVSSKLDSVISRSVALAANVQNGLSFLESQDAAQGRLGDIITRMAELRQRFDDPTLNTGDGNNLNREFKELKEEIKSIAKGKFNGISLFSNESDNQSKLVVNTATDDRSTLREISRNLFFNSILDTNSTAGPIGANRTVQGSAGSFAGATVTPTGGTSPAQTINGAAGSTPAQLIQGVQGTTPNQVVNGGAPGTTPAQVAKGTEGATPNQTVNGGAPGTTPAQVAKGAQGSTLNQTVNGGASGTTTNQTVNAAGGSVANQSIKTLPVANLTGIGSGYDPIETAPTVTITGTNKGTLAGTTGIRPDGKLNVTFSGAGVPSSGANATELWNTGTLTNQDADTKPAVDSLGNVYFVGSSDGGSTVNAVNPADGTGLWSVAVGGEAICNPTLSSDEQTLFVGYNNGLRAFNTVDGSIRWSYASGAVQSSQPVLSNDGQTVYFGSNDDDLHAVSTVDGSGKWTFGTGSSIQSAPVVDSAGNIYVASTNRNVYKIQDNGATGTQVWVNNFSFSGAGTFQLNSGSSPALSNDESVLYLGDGNGNVTAINTALGSDNWGGSAQVPGNIRGKFAVGANDNVYFTSTDRRIFAFRDNGTTATQLGSFEVNGSNFTRQSPTVNALDQVFFTSTDGRVFALDGDNPGTWGDNINLNGVQWQANMGATTQSTPALDPSGNIVYVGDNQGRVFAYEDPIDITVAVASGTLQNPANLSSIGSGYDPTETAPTVTITGTDAGTLAGTSSINPDGTLNVTFAGASTGNGNIIVAVANGLSARPANLAGIGTGYDPAETPPVITVTGADKGTLAGTATIKADGTLDVAFSGNPMGNGNLTAAIATGVMRNPANLANIGSGYDPTETVPAVTITGTGAGTLAGTSSINPDGTINIAFSGAPTGTGNLNVAIANGLNPRPANLAGIGAGYDPTETAPVVTITGADAGTLTGTAPGNADGTLNVTFAGNPTGVGNITTAIAPGVIRPPTNLTSIGSGYKTGEPVPAVTFVGANKGTLAGTSSVNVDGTLNVAITGAPTDTNNVTVNVATGVLGVNNLSGIGSGYTQGDPVPVVSFTGANAGTLAGTASINLNGTVDVSFSGNPTDTNNFGVQIANGLARAANLPGIGSGYDPAEAPPVVTITGASKNTLAGTTGINANGTLDLTFTGNPSDFSNLDVQVASGTLHAPPTLAGLGGNHNAASPPSVTISGADAGTLTGTASVNPDGTVNVSFGGTPSGTGSLNVNIAGDTSSSVISNQYLLELDGDLWDYSVAEFDNFTELIADARAQNGADQNSLGTSWELLSTNLNQLEKATGRIKNADYAKEMTNLGKSQILNQSAAMMLGNQNRITSEALLTIQRLKNKL
jgi:flagellin-like hook-associated protein FlgL